jgi:RNA polymerase sigma factor (TIGR02999 family)
MTEVTRILNAIGQGDPVAAEQLLPLVYGELRKLAAQRLAREKPGQTLEPTALVHEAYLRLVGLPEGPRWNGRNHFFAAAAEAMRRILVETARRKQGPKHGGCLRRMDADLNLVAAPAPSVDLLALDEALTKLAKESPARAEFVKLRFFAGLTVSEAAEILGISRATAERHWTYARTWLFAELGGAEDSPPSPQPIPHERPGQEKSRNP